MAAAPPVIVARNTTQWGSGDFTEAAGCFSQNGQLKYYTSGSITGNNLAVRD